MKSGLDAMPLFLLDDLLRYWKKKSNLWFGLWGHFWEKIHSWKIKKIAVRDHPFMMSANFTLLAILKTLSVSKSNPSPLQIADVLNKWMVPNPWLKLWFLKTTTKQMMKSAHFLVMLLMYKFWKQQKKIGQFPNLFLSFVTFIPYFRLLVFGILVTLVAWFSFRLPILPCKM